MLGAGIISCYDNKRSFDKINVIKIVSITFAILFLSSVAVPIEDVFAGNGSANCAHSDCSFPTLGVNEFGKRMVWGGFTYNGQTVDATNYYTEFPLITTKVGKQNTAVLKVTDNLGAENIRHVALGFGNAYGTFFGDAHTSITLEIDFTGKQTVYKTDPHNAIKSYSVSTEIARVGNGFPSILEVTIMHKFAKELPFNIVSVNVWDDKRNARQFFFNDGVQVIDPNKAVEQVAEIAPKKVVDEGVTKHGYDRAHPIFDTYKQGQELLAKQVLAEICPSCVEKPFGNFKNNLAYGVSEPTKAYDTKIQKVGGEETTKVEKMNEDIHNVLDMNVYKPKSTHYTVTL